MMMPNKFKLFLGQFFFSKSTPISIESRCQGIFDKAHLQFKDNPGLQELIQDSCFQKQTKPSLEYYLLNHSDTMAMKHLTQLLEQHPIGKQHQVGLFFSSKPKVLITHHDLNQLYLPFQKK